MLVFLVVASVIFIGVVVDIRLSGKLLIISIPLHAGSVWLDRILVGGGTCL